MQKGGPPSFGFLCNMTAIRLPKGGCIIYSPILGPDDEMESVEAALDAQNLLPVEAVFAPISSHHLALAKFQEHFSDAAYVSGPGSMVMPPLSEKRRDIRWDVLLDVSGTPLIGADRLFAALSVGLGFKGCPIEVLVVDDAVGREVMLLHNGTNDKTLICADLLYKSSPTCCPGPGGPWHRYTKPNWFSDGLQELFYRGGRMLPSYRLSHKAAIDLPGMRKTVQKIVDLSFNWCTLKKTVKNHPKR